MTNHTLLADGSHVRKLDVAYFSCVPLPTAFFISRGTKMGFDKGRQACKPLCLMTGREYESRAPARVQPDEAHSNGVAGLDR